MKKEGGVVGVVGKRQREGYVFDASVGEIWDDDQDKIKFAVFRAESGNFKIFFFSSYLQHDRVILWIREKKSGLFFLGAGVVTKSTKEATWGSTSCTGNIMLQNKDRPDLEKDQERVIGEVKRELESLLEASS